MPVRVRVAHPPRWAWPTLALYAAAVRWLRGTIGVAACGAALTGCGADDPSPTASTSATKSPVSTSLHPTTPPQRAATTDGLTLLALGDSLSRGVQPDPSTTLVHGYPRALAATLERRTRLPVALVEAGCGGATTVSFIDGGKACPDDAPVPYANATPQTSQLAWADAWLRRRGDRPTLVTLSLGGNDVLGCANAASTMIRQCIENGSAAFGQRFGTIIDRLGAAAGRRTVFAGMTLYDPLLGLVPLGRASLETVGAFHDGLVGEVNPFLRERFDQAGWEVADLGAAAKEDEYLDSPTSRPITEVCTISWACTPSGDIHLNDAGYALAARLHARAVARRIRDLS